MNVIDQQRVRMVFRGFAQGLGIRAAARAAKVNRETAARYYRQWRTIQPMLKQAYEAMWNGNGEECDRIAAELPDAPVMAMLDAWLDDQGDVSPVSIFYEP